MKARKKAQLTTGKKTVISSRVTGNRKIAKNRGKKWQLALSRGRVEAAKYPTTLRVARLKKKLDQKDIIRGTDLTASTYGQIERAKRLVFKDRAVLIAKKVGVSLDKAFVRTKKQGIYVARQAFV